MAHVVAVSTSCLCHWDSASPFLGSHQSDCQQRCMQFILGAHLSVTAMVWSPLVESRLNAQCTRGGPRRPERFSRVPAIELPPDCYMHTWLHQWLLARHMWLLSRLAFYQWDSASLLRGSGLGSAMPLAGLVHGDPGVRCLFAGLVHSGLGCDAPCWTGPC